MPEPTLPRPVVPVPFARRHVASCPPRRGDRMAGATLWALALCARLVSAPAEAIGADSTTVRLEIGAATESSNEQFYESSIDDTTFLGRRLLDAPQTRVAAVAHAELQRTLADGRWLLRLAPDLSLGDEALRAAASATLRGQAGDRLRLAIEPRAEYRRDDGLGLTRRDWRASVTARARRLDLDELGALRLSAGSELVRSLEGADGFVLSGQSARAALGYARAPLLGPEWDLEYGLVARTYRDSTDRNHLEHRAVASLRSGAGSTHDFMLVAEGERRRATRRVSGSRDRFVRLDAEGVAVLATSEAWSLRPSAGIEWVRYDEPDSVVDFDYAVSRAQLTIGREFGIDSRVSLGVRAEWLAAAWNPAEEYGEFAAVAEFERVTGGTLWSLAPAVGRRTYVSPVAVTNAGGLLAPLLHSNFRFMDVTGFLDQPLPARLRLRVTGAARAEWHSLADHDARSLYFSCDVRRLF